MGKGPSCNSPEMDKWTNRENLEHCKLTWKDLCESVRKPNKLHHRIHLRCSSLAQEPKPVARTGSILCCLSTHAKLRDIPTGGNTSLSQGCCTWRHNQVLRHLLITLEGSRSWEGSRSLKTTLFKRAGQLPATSARVEATLLDNAGWFGLTLVLVSRSKTQKALFIVELTVPWETAISEADEHKHHSSRSSATWLACPSPSCWGRMKRLWRQSTTKLLKGMGVGGPASWQASDPWKTLQSEATTGSGSTGMTPAGLQSGHQGVHLEGGKPGKRGVAVEPCGGVVDSSTTYQWCRVPIRRP